MAEAAHRASRRVRISSKRQITIPAKTYRDMGFAEYALLEETSEGLLIKPLQVQDEGLSLDILRQLIDEGYEGEELVERFAAVCPRVLRFSDLASPDTPARGSNLDERSLAEQEPGGERARILQVVAEEAAKFAAITRAFVFGSFARGDFTAESDIDVRLEYDEAAPFSLFEVAQFQKRIERLTGRSVDVVTAKRLKNPNLAAAIEREKVLAYERESN